MTKRSKNWFFIITNVLRSDNTWGGVRFRKRDKPTQETMKDLCDSVTFKEEPGDKATTTQQGLVRTVSDANAKSNTEPDSTYTYVPEVSQIPTIETESQIIGDFTGNALNITADAGTTTRNRYIARLATDFANWLLTKFTVKDVTQEVRVATTTSLTGTYNSVNKTFTLTAVGALTIDGVTLAVGNRVLDKDNSTGSVRGIYEVTVAGDGATQAVLTRTSDFDSSNDVKQFQSVYVTEGTSSAGTRWIISSSRNSFTLDTTSITFSLIRMIVGGIGSDGAIAHINYFTGTGFALFQNATNGSTVVNAPNTGKVFIQNQNTTVAEFSISEGEKFHYPIFKTQDLYLRDGVTPETYKKVLERDTATPDQGIFKIGNEATRMDFQVPFSLPHYSKTSLPSATKAGQKIWVTDDVGGATEAVSNGTSWLRSYDRAVIS